ncbi:FliM/FliN family flagellar motor C-terminal domain-containing protein [Cribrihabitans pelagius]|uniref:FliM/FliN family flagellar motor switch protein n=1 Tax=Cribrihabitans pelagius TaxID=1765746 RepID=UPI003B5C72EA
MSETGSAAAGNSGQSVLARKLSAAKDGIGAASSSLTLKALRRSVARAAIDLCELPVVVLAARQANRMPEDLAEHLSDKDLLVVLDGPAGRIGAATMDAPTVTALIQKQTIGQVMGKAPAERHYTPTDAAMTAEFLEKLFAKAVAMLEGQSDEAIFSGYSFGAQVEDVRTLVLGLEAEDYRVIEMNLDLANGAMQGQMKLILPEPTPDDLQDGANGSGTGPSLGRNLGSMRAELSAVLCKMRVPLSTFTGLKTGDVLPLDQAYLYETDLLTIGGQPVAQGRLGQMNGARAIRLNQTRTRLVAETEDAGQTFSEAGSGGALELAPAEAPALDLGIAAQGLQDAGDDGGFPALGGGGDLGGDLGGGLDDLAGELGDIGSGMGGDLGSGPEGGLPALPGGDGDGGMAPMEFAGLGSDSALALDGFGGGLDSMDPGDAAAEISQLAGLDGPGGGG